MPSVVDLKLTDLPVDQVVASVPGMGSGHDLDQCGFSRAVLSAQRVDLTLADVKRDAVQRPDAGEDLHDVFELDKYLALAQSDSPFLKIHSENKSPRLCGPIFFGPANKGIILPFC